MLAANPYVKKQTEADTCSTFCLTGRGEFMRISFIIFVLSFVFITCHKNNLAPSGILSVNTDSTLYSMNSRVKISILNNADYIAHFPSCCSNIAFYLDKYDSASWHEYRGYGIPCLLMCPSIDLTIPSSKQKYDSIYIADQGTFRLRMPFGRSIENTMAEEIISNTFMIQ